jgi:hypothetical protein
MNISKKLLPASITAVLIAGVLTGCPSKEAAAPDQAVKEAYSQFVGASYNFDMTMTADIKEDETALIGTQGGLTPEEAEEELEMYEELKSPENQQVLAMIKNGRLDIKGAVDGKAYKYELFATANYEMNGMKASFEVPVLLELKNEAAIYVDPKAAKAFNMLPPQIGNKLIKMTINDIPGLKPQDKEKFKSLDKLVGKYEKILNASFQKTDASLFKEVEVSAEAKNAGATRLIELNVTPEQAAKMSEETTNEVLKEFGTDFNLSQQQVDELKSALKESNANTQRFMINTSAQYGLNDKGQIVYVASNQSYKGAKHVGNIKVSGMIKDYDKPTFVIDPVKQGTISAMELMMAFR